MKKLINSISDCVDESLLGLVAANNSLVLLKEHRVIYNKNFNKNTVSIISGGGAGHEPSHSGLVGDGLLTAAVSGDVFASPSASQVFAAIKAVATPKGVLLIVKNYTGDRLQFGKAAERAKKELNIDVQMVIVGDDSAIPKSKTKSVGRRGLCGTLLVHKVAGSQARSGASLSEVSKAAQGVALRLGTAGIALSPCSLPGRSSNFEIGSEEMVLGLGIHGESGLNSVKLGSSKEAVEACLDMILESEGKGGDFKVKVDAGDDGVVVVVNNLGGTTILEMGILINDTRIDLERRGIKILRIFSGSLMTSLEMAGFSLTILPILKNDKTLAYLDEKVDCFAWPFSQHSTETDDFQSRVIQNFPIYSKGEDDLQKIFLIETEIGLQLARFVLAACESLVREAPQITLFDMIAGDGDCGDTLSQGSKSLIQNIKVNKSGDPLSSSFQFDTPSSALSKMSFCLEKNMGGSSGALYCLFLDAMAKALTNNPEPNQQLKWALSLSQGLDAIMLYGGAKVGDCTMIDALYPGVKSFLASVKKDKFTEALKNAVEATKDGVHSTENMANASLGRSVYVGTSLMGVPDPGAYAIWKLLESGVKTFEIPL